MAATRRPDREFVFKNTPQGELRMFAYLPAGWQRTDKRPAIVFFFGGGFIKGTPQQFFSKAEYLASRGMVAFSAEYRVLNTHKTTVDKCVEDARSAMRFVRSHAGDWGVDCDRLVSSGGSAGAHLAAAAAMLDGIDDPTDDLKVSCRPTAMVLFNPALDLTSLPPEIDPSSWEDRFPGRTLQEKAQSMARLSPIKFLRRDLPPAIMFYGENDPFLRSAREFVSGSRALGNTCELLTAPGMAHGFFNAAPWHQATLVKADEFLASLGFLTGSPSITPASGAVLINQT